MKPIEIGNVVRVEDTPECRGKGQLFPVSLLSQTGIQNGDDGDTAGTKSRDQTTMHRIFVEVELDFVHRGGSAPVLSFQNLSFAVLCCQVYVDFFLVGVVVGESCMNLRKRQVTSERLHDFFRNLARVMPLSDSAN